MGRTIKVDELSLSSIRGKFAKCCVEIDLSAPLVPSLIAFDFAQKVEYEGLHLICFDCGRYGHKVEEFPESNPMVAEGTLDSSTEIQGSRGIGGEIELAVWTMDAT